MGRRLRAGIDAVVGLFVTGWMSTVAILAILAGGWALTRRMSGSGPGFAMAGALAALIVAQALVFARRHQH
jgi:hypothetical protein